MDVLDKVSNNTVNLNIENSSLYAAQTETPKRDYVPVKYSPQAIEQPAQQIVQTVAVSPEAPTQQLREERISTSTKSRKSTFKKAKKRKSVRLKARKKVRKYKGTCPRF